MEAEKAGYPADDIKNEVVGEKRTENIGEKTSSSDAECDVAVIDPEFDEKEGRKVLSKVDYRLVPLLALLYLISFIDRSNSRLTRLPDYASRISVSVLTKLYSWKCKDCRPDYRPEHARPSIQHRCHLVLRSLHSSRSPLEHRTQDDEAQPLDRHSHVFLGPCHDSHVLY